MYVPVVRSLKLLSVIKDAAKKRNVLILQDTEKLGHVLLISRLASDQSCVSFLVLINLGAVFDTIDYNNLLERL